MKTPCVIYVRVSTEEQTRGTSPASQLEQCEQHAARLNMQVIAVCYDLGVSGARYETRPGIQKALGYIERREARAIIGYKVDRIGRSTKVVLDIAERCAHAGGRLITCDGIELGGSVMGDAQLTMMAMMASMERGLIRERTMTGKRALAKDGAMPSRGRMPYAYRIVRKADVLSGVYPPGSEGTYQIDEERAKWVRGMYERYANGSSFRKLSEWLHENDVPTATGTPYWHPNTIRDLLTNPVNKGTAVYGHHEHRSDESRLKKGYKTDRYDRPAPKEQWIEISVPAIISEDLWSKVQAKIATNQSTKSGNPGRRYALTGILRCKKCGTLMIAKSRREFQYYYCRYYGAAQSPSGHVCDKKSYRLRAMEEFMVRGLTEFIQRPDLLTDAIGAYREYMSTDRRTDAQKRIDKLRQTLSDLASQEEALVTAQVEGIRQGVNPAFYAKMFAEVFERREATEKALQELNSSDVLAMTPVDVPDVQAAQEAIKAVEAVLTSELITPAEKNELISTVVEQAFPVGDELEIELKPVHEETVGLIVILRWGNSNPELRIADRTRSRLS